MEPSSILTGKLTVEFALAVGEDGAPAVIEVEDVGGEVELFDGDVEEAALRLAN